MVIVVWRIRRVPVNQSELIRDCYTSGRKEGFARCRRTGRELPSGRDSSGEDRRIKLSGFWAEKVTV